MRQQLFQPVAGMRANTSRRQAHGSRPLSLAGCTRFIATAARCPTSALPTNRQDFTPRFLGPISRSIKLLSMVAAPSSRSSGGHAGR